MGGIPVKVGNDANVAALGEMWKGGGEGSKSIIMVTLGTGVGGGIIVNGKIVTGAHGAGGEIGHACINPDEPEQCKCGNHGCLEQYASATGIVRIAKQIMEKSTEPTELKAESLSAKAVFDMIKSGEKVYEGRLNDEKRQLIDIGDVIEFQKEPELKEAFNCIST